MNTDPGRDKARYLRSFTADLTGKVIEREEGGHHLNLTAVHDGLPGLATTRGDQNQRRSQDAQ
jgi:hypothetical protein